MYTVDASVWINGFDQTEEGHEDSRRFLEFLHTQAHPVFLPNLACVEVAGAIARSRGAPARAREFAMALADLPNVTLWSLDDEIARQAQALAADHALRGADAVYAAVALRSGSVLVSLDREHLTRLSGVVAVKTPAAVLDEVELQADEAELGAKQVSESENSRTATETGDEADTPIENAADAPVESEDESSESETASESAPKDG